DGLSASAAKEARSERSVSEKCSGLLLRFVSVADLPPALGPFYHFFEFSFTERRFHAETWLHRPDPRQWHVITQPRRSLAGAAPTYRAAGRGFYRTRSARPASQGQGAGSYSTPQR